MIHRSIHAFFVSAVVCAAATRVSAQHDGELGRMWTFENPPLAYLEAEYGFKPDQVWFDKVRMASLRFGQGCSSAFVSPRGLIMTNHHCLREDIEKAQVAAGAEGADWLSDGFVAGSLEDEQRIPGLTVQQLVAIRDVTEDVDAGIANGDAPETIAAKREANREKILAEAESAFPGRTAEIVELFQGARYALYVYRVFDDLRLVMAPHLQTAHFGGDPDNFTYPRYGIDFGFVRAYVDGVPADSSDNYFRWSEAGAQKGEVVFVTGNPGSTSRLLTFAQMQAERDASKSITLQLLDHRIAILEPMMEADPAFAKRARTTVLSWQNAQKAFRGELAGLGDPELMARKQRAELEFRQSVAADVELAEEYGGLWDEIGEIAAVRTALQPSLNFHTGGGSPHVEKALAIVRAVDAASLGGENAGELASAALAMPVRSGAVTGLFVADHIERARDWLPENDPYLDLVTGGGARTPAEAEVWLSGSRVVEQDFVAELLAGGSEAVLASADPAVRVARFVAPRRAANLAAVDRLDARAQALGTKIGRALFEVYGDQVSPDATFTLRMSDGVVAGYEYNGTLAPWRTSFYGLYGRNVAFGDRYPFDLPEVWKERRDRIDLSKAVDFVCTVDSTGGNSGSPVINREREIVGLLFDGNIESLPNEYVYDERAGRSVCVHVHAILEALQKVYDAGWVADELLAGSN